MAEKWESGMEAKTSRRDEIKGGGTWKGPRRRTRDWMDPLNGKKKVKGEGSRGRKRGGRGFDVKSKPL